MNEVTKIDPQVTVAALPADPMISMIERVMLNPAADLDKLERMLALKREHEKDLARVSFARALSMARADIPPIIKDASVDFKTSKGRTHYMHETLAGIAKAIDPILSQHGLSYRFRTDQGQGGVRVTCIIAHAEGHSEETSLVGAPDGSGSKNSFQAVGSAVTYLQRYTLKAALGLSAEVDDDGQGAAPRSGQTDTQQDHKPQQKPQGPNHRSIADRMIGGIRQNGAPAVESDPAFPAAFHAMKAEAPEIASQVEVELETWRKANQPAASSLIDGDEIPY